jgi:hypothetical protein
MGDVTFMSASGNASTSVRLPAVGKIKYNVPLAPQGGGGSRPLRLYDFRLAAASALDHTDLNSLWLCVGRDPVQRFGGAWLLTAAYDVEAWLPASTLTEFNHHEGKTYLRLWFVAGKESVMPYDKFKMFVVRVALVSKPDEMFLTVGGAQPPAPAASPAKFMNPPAQREQWKLYYPQFPQVQQHSVPPLRQQDIRNRLPQQRSPLAAGGASGVIFNPWGEQQPLAPAAPAAPARQPPPPNYPPPPLQQAQAPIPSGFSAGGIASYGMEDGEYVPQ